MPSEHGWIYDMRFWMCIVDVDLSQHGGKMLLMMQIGSVFKNTL